MGTSHAVLNGNDQVALTDPYGEDPRRAKLYSNGTPLQDLGVLAGYSQSFAADLNDGGHVVGTSADGAYDLREGFFWDGQALLEGGTLGGPRSEANGVNVHDVVVGSAQTPKGEWHPFVRDMSVAGSRAKDLQKMLDSSGAGSFHPEQADVGKVRQSVKLHESGAVVDSGPPVPLPKIDGFWFRFGSRT